MAACPRDALSDAGFATTERVCYLARREPLEFPQHERCSQGDWQLADQLIQLSEGDVRFGTAIEVTERERAVTRSCPFATPNPIQREIGDDSYQELLGDRSQLELPAQNRSKTPEHGLLHHVFRITRRAKDARREAKEPPMPSANRVVKGS